MGEKSKSLKSNSGHAIAAKSTYHGLSAKVIPAKVEKSEGGEIKDHRIKTWADQATTIEVEVRDTTSGATAANTFPTTTVGAVLPRWKAGGGFRE